MVLSDDNDFELTTPVFQDVHDELFETISEIPADELQAIYKVSDKMFGPLYDEILRQKNGVIPASSPALLTYSGIAFRTMAPNVFDDEQWDYVNKHLRILSAMYGVLRPLDGVIPYRLEMQQKLPFSLYEFWGERLVKELDDEVIINLASKEYSKAVTPFQKTIDVFFYEEDRDGKRKEKGVYAKIARGAMVRWLAENRVEDPKQMKDFDLLGYHYDPDESSEKKYVFVRKEN